MEKRDSIDLSAIDLRGSLHCALRVEMHAVCQLMGMNLKRCQVVGGHRGGGWARGQWEVAGEEEETWTGSKGTKYEMGEGGRRQGSAIPMLSWTSVAFWGFNFKGWTWKRRAERKKGETQRPSEKHWLKQNKAQSAWTTQHILLQQQL